MLLLPLLLREGTAAAAVGHVVAERRPSGRCGRRCDGVPAFPRYHHRRRGRAAATAVRQVGGVVTWRKVKAQLLVVLVALLLVLQSVHHPGVVPVLPTGLRQRRRVPHQALLLRNLLPLPAWTNSETTTTRTPPTATAAGGA